MASSIVHQSTSERWKKAHVGELSHDFLRVLSDDASQNIQPVPNWQQPPAQCLMPNHFGRLIVTCIQAKLSRNYGITKMDPYVRVRVGNFVYETQTCPSGGKSPYWNRAIQCQLLPGVEAIHVEIYDECSFKMDELIAWADIPIPETVIQGKTHEGSYVLSGKQGVELEGTIDIVLSYSLQPYTYPYAASTMYVAHPARPIFLAPAQNVVYQQAAPAPVIPVCTEEDFKQIREMFPTMDEQVLRTVLEANQGNKTATINCLLTLNEE